MNARPAAGRYTMDNFVIERHALGRPLLVRSGPPYFGLQILCAAVQPDADGIEKYLGQRSSC